MTWLLNYLGQIYVALVDPHKLKLNETSYDADLASE